jgi:acyl-CoA synthetase (AMP-forming)/AMP-acid ligase II
MNSVEPGVEILWERWTRNADKYPDRDAIIHWVAGEPPFRWTFSELLCAAAEIAETLLEQGIKSGEVCAILFRHNRQLYPHYLAVSCVGAIPAILAYPNPRLHPDKFRQGIEGMSQRSGLDWVLTERDLQPMLAPSVAKEGSTIKGVLFPLEWDRKSGTDIARSRQAAGSRHAIRPSDPILLQHSSGTTGLQKPVVLSHLAVLEHVKAYGSAVALNESDKIVSWLPLYHDMGLIAAFHLPLAFGIPSVQIDPFEWVLAPSILLQAVSAERATISWLPNFALSMMVDKIRDDEVADVDLESWRLIVNCSEPIMHESNQKFLARFRQYGLRSSAIASCYAMAEATFAVTQTPPGVEPKCLSVDRQALAKGSVAMPKQSASARLCVSSGALIAGCDVRIVGDNGLEVGDGTVGEIAIKSISLFEGYRNYPEKTAEVLRDGWYYSGDYGFRNGNDYYVIGRKKDTIIVAGNNIYPEDVEAVVGQVEGILPGRVVAFGEEDQELGSERVSIIAETEPMNERKEKELRLQVIKAGMSIDVSIAKVYFVPPRWLIKSSAGKPSRSANKLRILSGATFNQRQRHDYERVEIGSVDRSEVGGLGNPR